MTPFSQLAATVRERLATRPLLRAINFHNTARANAGEFERQFAHCARYFQTFDEGELDDYLATGAWRKPKPPILLAFYEGYRNNHDVIVPLLEKYGLTGWFFVITGFVDCPVDEQLDYIGPHDIGMSSREYPDGRYALSWDELRMMDSRHVIASHALSHMEIATMNPDRQRAEIVGSQAAFVRELGHPVRAFVSYGGPAYGENSAMDALVEEAGYRFVVSGYRIQRLGNLVAGGARMAERLASGT